MRYLCSIAAGDAEWEQETLMNRTGASDGKRSVVYVAEVRCGGSAREKPVILLPLKASMDGWIINSPS